MRHGTCIPGPCMLVMLILSLIRCRRKPVVLRPAYAPNEHILWEAVMPILEIVGSATDRRPPGVPRSSSDAAKALGALPKPPLPWNEDVARETAHLYDRIKAVVPSVEWPFFAPYVKAINALKAERNA